MALRSKLGGLGALFFLAVGCSSFEETEKSEATAQAIIGGAASDESQDAVVAIVMTRSGKTVPSCTATFLAENLLITARHCVSEIEPQIACDKSGDPLVGGMIGADYPAADLGVVVGTTTNWSSPTVVARGQRILHDPSATICNHDLAFVLLDRPVKGARIAKARIGSPVKAGERITAVGWGFIEGSVETSHRMARWGVTVLDVGPTDREIAAGPAEFVVGESTCMGDSGGPAVSAEGEIIGVVSRGGNGTAPPESDPAQSCMGENARVVYTAVAPYAALVEEALKIAGDELARAREAEAKAAEDAATPGTVTTASARLGVECTQASDCESNLCVETSATGGVCTRSCKQRPQTDEEACPSGWSCVDTRDVSVCKPAQPMGSSAAGCSMGRDARRSGGGLGALLLVVTVFATTRRRATSKVLGDETVSVASLARARGRDARRLR
jgi:hypothetical protein